MPTTTDAVAHPIVFLWSHPRSLSTAVERVMRERGDFECHHEPFMYFYYLFKRGRGFPHFDAGPSHPTGYQDIRSLLLARAEAGPVFVKDMSYYVVDEIMGDEAFARRVTSTFLIRDPMRSIVSYHRLDPDFSLDEVGLEAECRHFRWLTDLLGEPPPLIDAADVLADPARTLEAYAAAIGVDFIPGSLEWSKPPPKEWDPVAGWHRAVASATGIRSDPRSGGGAALGDDADAILDVVPRLRELYLHHRPYYEELRAHRLAPSPALSGDR